VFRDVGVSSTDEVSDSWSAGQRGKFPDNLRPPLRKVGQTAFQYDLFTFEVKEGKDISPFFESLPSVLPYNKFTLTVSPARWV
jgi:hypothetical protein